ncbi:MAG: EamA family transporter [Candidatus Tectimicrobiota bacterium]
MDVQAYGILLLGILIGVAGQLLLKYGMSRQPGFRLGELHVLLGNMPVLSGFGCYGLSTLLYLGVLARLELSLAYPTVSLGYVLVIIMSRLIFKEPVPPIRWLAAGIICGGVVLVGLGAA